MRIADIVTTASSNMMRSKVRSILTVLAVFVGALTITLTIGISNGISSYIDEQLGNLGASNVLIIQAQNDLEIGASSSSPKKYDPERTISNTGQFGISQAVLTDKDIDAIRNTTGINSVDPNLTVAVDYISSDNTDKYQINVSTFIESAELSLATGNQLDNKSSDHQIVLPISYVEVLGFGSSDDALDKQIVLAITDATGIQHEVNATVVGIQGDTLVNVGGASVNSSLLNKLNELQTSGLPESAKNKYRLATAYVDTNISKQELDEIKSTLGGNGYSAMTVQDQIGTFKEVINAITYVLVFFGAIALLAASLGIINTLFMAVQERTKEIGLMKAVGMSKSKIFLLFSFEAILLGFWGSVMGVLFAVLLGQIANDISAKTFLKDLQGFDLTYFPLPALLVIIFIIMLIAFLAGTLPARRAARQSPIDALRYE